MTEILKLPIGIENFQEIRRDNFYYIDKTKLIESLLNRWGKANLITRPRRFGKTLNMSMLRYFFEIGTDKTLFDGLYISQKKELCQEYMGRYPVIFLSLKSAEGLSFEEARNCLIELIGREARRFQFLLDSEKLDDGDKEIYRALISLRDGQYTMTGTVFRFALKTLSQLLYKHYGQKTIILIDEYDVPLDKAFQYGYYQEMVALIRGLFGEALKTNDDLQFAVLTGCLRVSKESIFTGLNNLKVLSVTDVRLDEQFGFTECEVKKLLEYYHLETHLAEMKEWYDGYRFGNVDVYCPWDVINHIDRLCDEPEAKPQSYWINTSGNDLVRRFIAKADRKTKDEIERLVAGEAIEKIVCQELTYGEIDKNIDNIWSVLFTTGYLTQAGETERGNYCLKIPNEEIRTVYQLQIREWMKDAIQGDAKKLRIFWKDFTEGNTKAVEEYLTNMLSNTISFVDTKGGKEEKENSYHMILAALLASNADWVVRSNREAGDGLADIIVEIEKPDAGVIVELKHSATYEGMEKACENAIEQIKNRHYEEYLINDNRYDILIYGMAFYKKRCRVVSERLKRISGISGSTQKQKNL